MHCLERSLNNPDKQNALNACSTGTREMYVTKHDISATKKKLVFVSAVDCGYCCHETLMHALHKHANASCKLPLTGETQRQNPLRPSTVMGIVAKWEGSRGIGASKKYLINGHRHDR